MTDAQESGESAPVRLLELTLARPAENLALEAALWEEADQQAHSAELLRIWELASPVVVVGNSSSVAAEVDLAACQRERVPIIRRTSGGAAIVAGPGCLMYSLSLNLNRRPQLRSVSETHRWVLSMLVEALAPRVGPVTMAGTSDLTLGGRKFSGNSLRVGRNAILYHGTLLYEFPLELVGRLLRPPPREPEYRGRRSHSDFLTNLPLARDALVAALVDVWQAREALTDWPAERVRELVGEKYGRPQWNLDRQ